MSDFVKKMTVLATGAVALSLALAGAAGAAVTPGQVSAQSVSTIQGHCDAAIQKRLATLTDLTTRVNASTHLTAQDRSTLLGYIQSDQSGLTNLESQINGETTVAQLKISCQEIVLDYRVYVLLVPQERMVVAADAADSAVGIFNGVIPVLQQAIQAAQGSGGNPAKIADAQAKLADIQAKVADAQNQVNPVVGELVALTPASVNNGSAQSVLQSARTALGTARTDLRTARSDLQAAIEDLRTD